MRTDTLIMSLILMLVFFWGGYDVGLNKGKDMDNIKITLPEPKITPLEAPELTIDNVLIEIVRQDIRQPRIVLKQAILETRWFNCENCSLDVNNCFGFGWNGKTYNKYDNWVESVKAYKVWQDTFYNGGDYYIFLDKIGYAETKDYTTRLKNIEI